MLRLPTPASSNTQLKPIEISNLIRFRNLFLSATLPINIAVGLSATFMPPTVSRDVFKKFSTELQNSLNISGCSPEFIANLIPEYLFILLKNRLYTGELLEFCERIESDLKDAYDDSLPEKIQSLHKIRAFKNMMLEFGPHGLKHIQSMRPKNANSWISEAILTAQSDLPAVPIKEVEDILKDAFKTQGTLQYAEHFSEHFQVTKVLGAGSVGIVALVKFKETAESNERELVVKILRKGIIQRFISDNQCLDQAVDNLVAQKKATKAEAVAFKHFSKKKLEAELREANPNLENAHLLEMPYQGPNVTTVRGNLDLAGKASNIVFMEKAEGIELGKYLKAIRKILASPETSEQEKEQKLSELAKLRKHYCQLTEIHQSRVAQNLPVHTDLHPGNIFYQPETEKLSVLDLGGVARPVSEAAHLQLRRFLFHIYLSVGTGDAHYLRMYYGKYNHSDQIAPEKIENLLAEIQTKLDRIKKKSFKKNVIDTEKSMNEVMNLISNATLTISAEIVPAALITLARSNQILAEELQELNKDLADTHFSTDIAFSDRTPLAIALKATWKLGKSKNAELWTQEVWDYFREHSLSLKSGMQQFQFEKKFIYGIFGLNEREAAMADLLIPTAIISSPFVTYLASRSIYRTVKFAASKIPDLALSYRFVQACKNIKGVSPQEVFNKMHSTLSSHQFFKGKLPSVADFKNSMDRTGTFFRNPALKKFVPGLVVGGAAIYGAKKIREYRKS